MAVLTLTPPEEFRFAPNLAYLTRSPAESLYLVEDGTLYKLLVIEGKEILIAVRSPDDHLLEIGLTGDGAEQEAVQREVARYVTDWFDLATDLSRFYAVAEADTLLAPVIREWYGLRLIGVNDLFEAICWAIMGQQITLSFAYALKKSFVQTYGTSAVVDGKTYWSFPTPEVISNVTVDELRALKFTTRKAEYLIHIAGLFVDGTLSKEGLLRLGDFARIEKTLTSIRGIGPWSAHYVMMRCLRHHAAFPVQDVGLQNAVRHQLGMDRKPTIEELHDLAARWGEWKAHATFYLWMTLFSEMG